MNQMLVLLIILLLKILICDGVNGTASCRNQTLVHDPYKCIPSPFKEIKTFVMTGVNTSTTCWLNTGDCETPACYLQVHADSSFRYNMTEQAFNCLPQSWFQTYYCN